MNEVMQGEIALRMIKHHVCKNGIKIEGFQREVGNLSKELGIKADILTEFYMSLLPEMLSRITQKKVEIRVVG